MEKQGEFNVFIGISLGVLKPLTEEMAKDYISWALQNSKEKVAILVADEIAKYNYQIFSRYSTGKAQRRAEKEGDIHVDFFRKIIDKNFADKNIKILRWKDIWSTRKQRMMDVLWEEYESNNDFKDKVNFFLNKYAENRNKQLAEDQMTLLANYILAEMPTLLEGVSFDGDDYRLLLYPTFKKSSMSEMISEIQKGVLFPEVKERLGLKEETVLIDRYLPVRSEKL